MHVPSLARWACSSTAGQGFLCYPGNAGQAKSRLAAGSSWLCWWRCLASKGSACSAAGLPAYQAIETTSVAVAALG